MRLMDVMLALPSLLLAVAVVAVLGPGLANAMYAIAIVMLPHFVRLTRGAVLGELAKDYVAASRLAGAGTLRLMFDTVLPNCAAPLIVQATLGFSTAILDAAALGFLGLGAQPPTPEWGSMLASALEFIQSAWWVVTLPGLAILDHRARLQPHRRRPARRARPEAEDMSAAAIAAARGRAPVGRVRRAGRGAAGGRRRQLRGRRRRGGRHRRRIGLGQERDRAGGARPGRRARPGAGRAARLRRPRPAVDVAARAPRAPRRRHRDDLPGPDDQPEPVVHASPSS